MNDYWRPGFKESYREELEEFLEKNDDLPFEDPREFMKFCVDKYISDVYTGERDREDIKKKLERLAEEIEPE